MSAETARCPYVSPLPGAWPVTGLRLERAGGVEVGRAVVTTPAGCVVRLAHRAPPPTPPLAKHEFEVVAEVAGDEVGRASVGLWVDAAGVADPETWVVRDVEVTRPGRGVARAMYSYLAASGRRLAPSADLSDGGRALWARLDPGMRFARAGGGWWRPVGRG